MYEDDKPQRLNSGYQNVAGLNTSGEEMRKAGVSEYDFDGVAQAKVQNLRQDMERANSAPLSTPHIAPNTAFPNTGYISTGWWPLNSKRFWVVVLLASLGTGAYLAYDYYVTVPRKTLDAATRFPIFQMGNPYGKAAETRSQNRQRASDYMKSTLGHLFKKEAPPFDTFYQYCKDKDCGAPDYAVFVAFMKYARVPQTYWSDICSLSRRGSSGIRPDVTWRIEPGRAGLGYSHECVRA